MEGQEGKVALVKAQRAEHRGKSEGWVLAGLLQRSMSVPEVLAEAAMLTLQTLAGVL